MLQFPGVGPTDFPTKRTWQSEVDTMKDMNRRAGGVGFAIVGESLLVEIWRKNVAKNVAIDEPHVRPQLRLFPTKKTNSLWAELESWCLKNNSVPSKTAGFSGIILWCLAMLIGIYQFEKPAKAVMNSWLLTESWDLWAGNSCQKSDGFCSTSSLPRRCCFLNLSLWHDLEINTYKTLVGCLEPHVWKIWVKMGFLPSRGETNNFWNHHLKLHCNTGVLVDLLNICGRSCLKFVSNLYAGLQNKNNHLSLVTSHPKPVHAWTCDVPGSE